jgi:hypothetical protein
MSSNLIAPEAPPPPAIIMRETCTKAAGELDINVQEGQVHDYVWAVSYYLT